MPGDQSEICDALLHVADLHFWHVTLNPLRLLNKRVLGNFNVWWRRRHQFAMENALPFIDALDAAGPRTVLLTGDFSSTSLDDEFVRARRFVDALRDRGFALYLIPGNHDVYTFESVRKRRFETYFPEYVAAGCPPVRHTLPGGTPLILVPTVCPNLVSSRGRIADAETTAVKELLAGAPEPILVAGHYPVLHKTPSYETNSERRLRNAEALRDALGQSRKRILYIAGHVHRFSYVNDARYPNLTHLTTGTFFGHNKREHIDGEFARIDVTKLDFVIHRNTHMDNWHRVAASSQPENSR